MLSRLLWYIRCNRIGPDIPLTHFLLHWPGLGRWLCARKFGAFGRNSHIRPFAYAICTRNIFIGDNIVIRPGCMLFADDTAEGHIHIESGVILGAGVHIYVNNHNFDRLDMPIQDQGHYPSKPVRVRRGAWIGARAVILRGVTIGENAVVGAGAVVTRDVPPRTVVGGVPARIIRRLDAPAAASAKTSLP